MKPTCYLLSLFLAFSLPTSLVAGEDEKDYGVKERKKPNVIFILADDMGYGDLSCYGQKQFTTPRIDSLATEGMKFTRHYSGSTVCAPSRCCLMTGFTTGHGYIRGNMQAPVGDGDYPLAVGITTVADLFQKHGYKTGCFGKWGLGSNINEGDPQKHGFDEFFGYYGQRDAHNYYPPFLHHNGTKIELDRKTYSHDLIADKALEFIRDNHAQPFFCYVPVTIPHAAMQVPEPYVAPWREKYAEFENVKFKYSIADEIRNPVAAFPGMLSKLDETVGKILDLLEELNLADDTIVCFSSDNGPHLEGGHRSDLFDSNGPLRGYKRDMTEGGIRVPFLVKWPARIKPGQTTEHISAFWDFLPTVCEILGATPPEKIDGISFLPTLLGQTDKQKSHDYLYWEFYEQGGKRAVLEGNWKAIQTDVSKNPGGPVEIYDLSNDLEEKQNLVDAMPEKVEHYRKLFEQLHTDSELFKFR